MVDSRPTLVHAKTKQGNGDQVQLECMDPACNRLSVTHNRSRQCIAHWATTVATVAPGLALALD